MKTYQDEWFPLFRTMTKTVHKSFQLGWKKQTIEQFGNMQLIMIMWLQPCIMEPASQLDWILALHIKLADSMVWPLFRVLQTAFKQFLEISLHSSKVAELLFHPFNIKKTDLFIKQVGVFHDWFEIISFSNFQ